MASVRLSTLKTVLGRVWATLALGWLAGCSGSPTSAPAGAAALPSSSPAANSAAVSSQVVYKGKPDLDDFVARLKAAGTEPVTTKGIDLRTFHFSGMADLLELKVTIEHEAKPSGAKEPTEIVLTSDGVVKEGTINLAILPPASTGKAGATIVIEIVPEGPRKAEMIAREVSPLWYGTPGGRPRIQSGMDSGGKLPIRRKTRGLKLIGYTAAQLLDFRCRAVEPGMSGGKAGEGR